MPTLRRSLFTLGFSGLAALSWPQVSDAAPPPEGPPGAELGPDHESTPEAETEPEAPDPHDERLEQLLQRVEALEAEIEQLRHERDELQHEPEPEPPPEPQPKPELENQPEPDEPPEGKLPVGATKDGQRPPDYADGFHFGSYGRVVAAGDLRGRPGRNADIVAHGSRMDEQTYAELELRREDYWEQTGAYTRIVATVAFAHPIFHYDANFDASLALRNLYIEELGLGAKGLSFWAGSRMYRGDDVYVLDWWPLDNLNTIGGGAGYQFEVGTFIKVHAGVQQPNDRFYRQIAQRPMPLNLPGASDVAILDRHKIVSSTKLGHVFKLGTSGGIKLIGYGETHHVRAGQRDLDYRDFEEVPADNGYVAGGEISLFSGKRSTHLNLWVRHAWGLAAHGDFAYPDQLGPDRTTKGARELVVALGGNYEVKFFGLMMGSYFRRFRNASPDLDAYDLNEGIVLLRPQFWFGQVAGTALEASYQIQQRGALPGLDPEAAPEPLTASLWRFGVMPFWTPGGRGSYARPHIRAMYMLTLRDQGAMSLYPQDDVFGLRRVDHLIGFGAEWWFGSTSYFRD